MKRLMAWLSSSYALDLRSLAAFRVGLGALVLSDLWIRSQPGLFQAFHTDAGVLPRTVLIESVGDAWRLTPQLLSGTSQGMACVFAVHALLGLALLLGWKSRLMALGCWILTLGLQNRTPPIIQGGDLYFRMQLLIAALLPIGSAFSLDRLFRRQDPEEEETSVTFSSAATFLLILQVTCVYFFAGLLKWAEPDWQAGLGTRYALLALQFATPLSLKLSQWKAFTWFANWATVWSELLITLVAFFLPLKKRPKILVWAGILGLAGLHLSISLLLQVGLFGAISIVPLLALIPSSFWKRRSRRNAFQGVVLYYDGECGVCWRMIVLLHRILGFPLTLARPAQSEPEVLARMEKENSWLLKRSDSAFFTRFDGIIELLSETKKPAWRLLALLLGFPPIRSVGNLAYRGFASHRPLMSRFVPDLESRAPQLPGWTAALVAAFVAVIIFLFNWQTLPHQNGKPLQNWIQSQRWIWLTGLDQQWGMFSKPMKDPGWYEIQGIQANGKEFDLLTQQDKSQFGKRPELISDTFLGDRWRKYWVNLLPSTTQVHRLNFGKYLCREWNSKLSTQEKLETFDIVYYRVDLGPTSTGQEPPKPTILWRHECFSGAALKWGRK